jgi:hypothetical protein
MPEAFVVNVSIAATWELLVLKYELLLSPACHGRPDAENTNPALIVTHIILAILIINGVFMELVCFGL